MAVHDYLIDHSDLDWSVLLAGWGGMLPTELTVWLMNRYGDLFLVYADGSVNMLDVGGGTVEQVADSRDDFLAKIDEDDNANQFLMIPLVDKVVEAGLSLKPGQCYGYKYPPVLGGDYTVENTAVISIPEHFEFHADFHAQIRDLPDGTPVMLVPTNVPDVKPTK